MSDVGERLCQEHQRTPPPATRLYFAGALSRLSSTNLAPGGEMRASPRLPSNSIRRAFSRSILSRACFRSFEITLDRAPGNRINFDMRLELFDAFARVAASRRKLPM